MTRYTFRCQNICDFFLLDFIMCRNSVSSLFAPTKLVPLSEYIVSGRLLWPINLLKAAINASDVRSVTASYCKAFVAKQTNSKR